LVSMFAAKCVPARGFRRLWNLVRVCDSGVMWATGSAALSAGGGAGKLSPATPSATLPVPSRVPRIKACTGAAEDDADASWPRGPRTSGADAGVGHGPPMMGTPHGYMGAVATVGEPCPPTPRYAMTGRLSSREPVWLACSADDGQGACHGSPTPAAGRPLAGMSSTPPPDDTRTTGCCVGGAEAVAVALDAFARPATTAG